MALQHFGLEWRDAAAGAGPPIIQSRSKKLRFGINELAIGSYFLPFTLMFMWLQAQRTISGIPFGVT